MTRIAPTPLPDPTLTLDGLTVEELLELHRARFGDARMDDDGDEGDDDGDDGQDGDDGDDDGTDGDDDGDDEDDDLAKTQKALKRERELRRKERKARREAERKLAESKGGKPPAKPDGGKGGSRDDAADAPTTEELREQVRRELQAEQRLERAGDRVVALAAELLADPADARALLDLDDLADDAGKVDEDEVREALEELLERKPYLRKSGRRRFGGGADAGADRGSTSRKAEPAPGLGRLRDAYESSPKKRRART